MDAVPKVSAAKKNRLLTLDYLRGFFIVVIIIDHFSRWPSLLGLLSGKALLWVTAAEGFVAISGLLVGYVRGFKNKAAPMKEVIKKLWSRALLLYIWSFIASVAYTAAIWYIPLIGGAPGMTIDKGDWMTLVIDTLTLNYTFVWTHFLMLYALFLAAAPLAVWLLRRGLDWLVVVLSLITLVIGWQTHIPVLQWQVLFFLPSVAGYHLESIMAWWRGLQVRRRAALAATVISLTLVTIILSVISTFYAGPLQSTVDTIINDGWFNKDTISLWRAGMAFLWFTGFIVIFTLFQKRIAKFFGWLLLPFGTRSLTAYILHGVAICLLSYFTLSSDNPIINTFLGIICILITWALVKLKFVQRIVPS